MNKHKVIFQVDDDFHEKMKQAATIDNRTLASLSRAALASYMNEILKE